MLKNKELSIIIVNYKSWLVLERCLESFRLYHPVTNYEIIVVDNDSQDTHNEPSYRMASTTEAICSNHVFIQNNEKGITHFLLHFVICTNTTVSQLLKVLLTLPIFWQPAFKISTFTFISTLQYYLNALQRKSWLSIRLPLNNHSY